MLLRHYSLSLHEGHSSAFLETVVSSLELQSQTHSLSQDMFQIVVQDIYSYTKLSVEINLSGNSQHYEHDKQMKKKILGNFVIIFLWLSENGNLRKKFKQSKGFIRQQAKFSSADAMFGTDSVKGAIASCVLFTEEIHQVKK